MPLFCRHNRLTASCPICGKELEAELAAKAPPRPAGLRPAASTATRSPRRATRATGRGGTGVVTRKLARPAEDGYHNLLVPGLRATADAERLAAALTAAAARLEPPGPYEALAEEPDVEEASWLAFLLALAGPDAPVLQQAVLDARPSWASGEIPDLPAPMRRTAEAYRAWAQRAGSQDAAFTADPEWGPTRRFARLFERLSLPGFTRAARFELLATLGALDIFPLEADSLHLGPDDDATTQAAKRLLKSGDMPLLERRAADLAAACELPLEALDRGLARWGTPGDHVDLTAPVPGPIRAALALR
jgi:hypothetical protein